MMDEYSLERDGYTAFGLYPGGLEVQWYGNKQPPATQRIRIKWDVRSDKHPLVNNAKSTITGDWNKASGTTATIRSWEEIGNWYHIVVDVHSSKFMVGNFASFVNSKLGHNNIRPSDMAFGNRTGWSIEDGYEPLETQNGNGGEQPSIPTGGTIPPGTPTGYYVDAQGQLRKLPSKFPTMPVVIGGLVLVGGIFAYMLLKPKKKRR